jgi:hypothetical protein
MSIGIVTERGDWPPAGDFTLDVLNDDGQHGRLFTPNQAEVTITAPPVIGPIPPKLERAFTIVSVAFSTLDQAERAGRILADAFAAVRAIQAEPVVDRDACEHRWLTTRFARSIEKTSVCELCGAVEAAA